jgi:digalactosyldiacylglycerol synthase
MNFSIILLVLHLIALFPGNLSAVDLKFRSPRRGREKDLILGSTPSDTTPESDLRDPSKRIWIITTAALPWLTGTSVNPLLRAAHLAKDRPPGKITLMVPWLRRDEQHLVFPKHMRFDHPNEQRAYMKEWLVKEADLQVAADRMEIIFYAARYHDEYHSVFPMGDITALIPDEEADVCVLEEPEHLNW